MKNDDKKSKNNNLILLQSLLDEKKGPELNEKEQELKDKLIDIEDRLNSVENVILAVGKERDDSLFNSEAFSLLVGSIAISAAINVIAEYFDVNASDIDNLLE